MKKISVKPLAEAVAIVRRDKRSTKDIEKTIYAVRDILRGYEDTQIIEFIKKGLGDIY